MFPCLKRKLYFKEQRCGFFQMSQPKKIYTSMQRLLWHLHPHTGKNIIKVEKKHTGTYIKFSVWGLFSFILLNNYLIIVDLHLKSQICPVSYCYWLNPVFKNSHQWAYNLSGQRRTELRGEIPCVVNGKLSIHEEIQVFWVLLHRQISISYLRYITVVFYSLWINQWNICNLLCSLGANYMWQQKILTIF